MNDNLANVLAYLRPRRLLSLYQQLSGHDYLSNMWGFLGSILDPRLLREYRCPNCRKLLAKGMLKHKEDALEVKCRGCATVCLFEGENAEIIQKRAVLLKEGIIPDTDKDKNI